MGEGEICLEICPCLMDCGAPAPIAACIVEQASSENFLVRNVDNHRGSLRCISCHFDIYCGFNRQAWVVECPDAFVVFGEVAMRYASVRPIVVPNKLQCCYIGKSGDAVT